MDDSVVEFPEKYRSILRQTEEIGFDQLSDPNAGSLLASLCASKPSGNFLELGTGTGLCTTWMLYGMCNSSSLISVDNDEKLVSVAKSHLGEDPRVEFVVSTGEALIEKIKPASIDLIFADTWPGKYHHLEETLSLLKTGGIYMIDDMLPQENWPEGHEDKADSLIQYLMNRKDLIVTRMCWSTGIVICTKNA